MKIEYNVRWEILIIWVLPEKLKLEEDLNVILRETREVLIKNF